jgi:aspartyl-tRNA(Asn)/glutamyl-tRNA(Gln) amidotransferase subunit C
MIDEAQVRHVATLARLKLSDDELARFSRQLSSILDYIGQLNEVDTEDVEPLSHPLELTNVFREDACTTSLARDEALAGAPEARDGFFIVPPVLEPTDGEPER